MNNNEGRLQLAAAASVAVVAPHRCCRRRIDYDRHRRRYRHRHRCIDDYNNEERLQLVVAVAASAAVVVYRWRHVPYWREP